MGAEVIVCEEHSQIGVPKHCTGHVSIGGLEQLGLSLPNNIIENRIRGAVFHSTEGREFLVDFESPVTFVLNRELFDKHLSNLASKAGVSYLVGEKAQCLLWKKDSVAGVSLKKRTIESDVVIDAEGCSSMLLKTAGLQSAKPQMMVNAVQGEVEKVHNIEEGLVEVYFGRNYAPGLFAWIVPRQDGSARVGLATAGANPRKGLEYFLAHHPKARDKLKDAHLLSLSYHPIPLGGPLTKTFYNGLLIVGDAASQVKPITGGGVITGLTCAKIAGEIAYHATENGVFSEGFLSSYQKRWQRVIGFDFSIMRRARLMLNSLSDKQLDKIIGWCLQFHLEQDLKRIRDVDFIRRSMLPIFSSRRTWTVALYSIFEFLKAMV
jgi:digeranylgeranylglycerophospholipid reductase